MHNLPNWWGTAVNVQAMVFGNLDEDSGTGVVFSHDPSTGESGLYGEFLPCAQGEDLVAGTHTPLSIDEMASRLPLAYTELGHHVQTLAENIDDMVDVEFTVEAGRLYILQVRRAKRTPLAAATFATRQVWAGRWSKEEALRQFPASELRKLGRSRFTEKALGEATVLGEGLAASPGAATGMPVFDSSGAKEYASSGAKVVLVRDETSPDDLCGMMVASAIVTRVGGATSHAAVVARELGIPAVVGVENLNPSGLPATISVDGEGGKVMASELPLVDQPLTKEAKALLKWTGGRPRNTWLSLGWVLRDVPSRPTSSWPMCTCRIAWPTKPPARVSKPRAGNCGIAFIVRPRRPSPPT
jgi:pyruvate,orthophosphate dikinase